MRIGIVTPAPPGPAGAIEGIRAVSPVNAIGAVGGNRITALRWVRILRGLGHRVSIVQCPPEREGAFDLLIALHARKSHDAIARFHDSHPGRPIVVAMTGTDLYGDLPANRHALRSIALAARIVVLNPDAPARLPRSARPRARVILQSVTLPRSLRIHTSTRGQAAGVAGAGTGERGRAGATRPAGQAAAAFDVCVLGNLRPVKDPFRAALAARLLPASCSIRVLHIGSALDSTMERRARAEQARNPRYRWLGPLGHAAALRRLARCRLLVLSSRMEGGANVLMEALALGVPVLCSRIAGSLSLLGKTYPGAFKTGDTAALARLLRRAETDPAFYADLRKQCGRKKALADPGREARAWKALLREICAPRPNLAKRTPDSGRGPGGRARRAASHNRREDL